MDHPPRRQALGQPGLGQFGVGQGFLGGEGLGHHHDQRGLGIQPGQGLAHVARIDIGHEPQVDDRIQRPQGVPQQARPQIRTADADVNDRVEGLFRPAGLGARTDVGRERGHGLARLGDLGRHRFAQRPEVGVVGGPKRRVQHRPPLGVVDGLAGEQRVAASLDVAGARQIEGGLEPLGAPRLFRQVQIQARGLDPHPLDAAGIDGELMQDASVGVLAGDSAQHVEGLGSGGHRACSKSRRGKPSFTGRA